MKSMQSKCYVGVSESGEAWGVFEVESHDVESRKLALDNLKSEFSGKVKIIDVIEDVVAWEE